MMPFPNWTRRPHEQKRPAKKQAREMFQMRSTIGGCFTTTRFRHITSRCMDENLQKLRKIVAKTFRKAKHWYLAYLIWEWIVLFFAVTSIFSEWSPNLSA